MPEDQRTVFHLSEIEGLSYEEIAGFFEVPVGTVKARIFRARELLKKGLRGIR